MNQGGKYEFVDLYYKHAKHQETGCLEKKAEIFELPKSLWINIKFIIHFSALNT